MKTNNCNWLKLQFNDSTHFFQPESHYILVTSCWNIVHSNKALANDSVTCFRPCADLSQQGTLFFMNDVDLSDEHCIIVQFSQSSHSHITCSHLHSHGNREDYAETTLIENVWKCTMWKKWTCPTCVSSSSLIISSPPAVPLHFTTCKFCSLVSKWSWGSWALTLTCTMWIFWLHMKLEAIRTYLNRGSVSVRLVMHSL